MVLACVDIGSNTTRLLVARAAGGDAEPLQILCQHRAFVCLGREVRSHGRVGEQLASELADVVAAQLAVSRQLGAQRVRVVATAALRGAADGREVVRAVARRARTAVTLLDEREEARLAFLGATRTAHPAPAGEVAIVDVGGGSTEIAVGTLQAGMRWATSLPIGSGVLAEAHLRGDPPTAGELLAVHRHAARELRAVRPPACARALAVGGSATSLRRLVGGVLDHRTLARGLEVLASAPCAQLAPGLEIDPRRLALLPAALLILDAASELLQAPLTLAGGGLREGLILDELQAARALGASRVQR